MESITKNEVSMFLNHKFAVLTYLCEHRDFSTRTFSSSANAGQIADELSIEREEAESCLDELQDAKLIIGVPNGFIISIRATEIYEFLTRK